MKNNNVKRFEKFCCGCGLCHSVQKVNYEIRNGFFVPKLGPENIDFCKKVCPSSGKHLVEINVNEPWGKYISALCTWSTNTEIRYQGSSGGTITAISSYLLDSKIIDKLILIKASEESQIKTETIIVDNSSFLKNTMGSRYTVSSPLLELLDLIEDQYTYGFIGKPCDIIALQNYMEIKPELKERIKITLSFFCAGLPSEKANLNLLNRLNTNAKDCQKLTYRGYGWPGYASVIQKDSSMTSITYNEAWGSILGRDVNYFCKFCMDGIGIGADISCGDAWYLDSNNHPDFTEHEGRNITFARTEKGYKILMDCIEKKYLEKQEYNLEELKYIQKHQYLRRNQVYPRIAGLIFCRKYIPFYDLKTIQYFSKNLPFYERLRIFLGTVKRVVKGKI